MPTAQYFRGGNRLKPRPNDVRIDPATGLLLPTHGVSVFDSPQGLEQFGGAFHLTAIPATLKIIQRGRNPHHFEIVPAHSMTMAAFEMALDKINLVPV